MTEREMEDLIAAYPDDFFPHKEFRLKGRQQSFSGMGRFDLLFTDRFQTNILMELKAVPAKYEVATQLAKYKDELFSWGERNILMWLVAPSISHSVREFLDRIGIEYSEIHEPEFRSVAARRGVAPNSTAMPKQIDHSVKPTETKSKAPSRAKSEGAKSQRSTKVIYESFKALMETAVLPQHAQNPSHFRLDGRSSGSNGKEAFRFRHNDRLWMVAYDTWYAPLEIAYREIGNNPTYDPFAELPTELRNGKSNGTRLTLRKGSTNMFIYLLKRKAKSAL
jgi:Endonuclease NucS